MQPLFAIAALSWKAAFRFRLFWVLTILLLGSVLVLPLLLKDDGTARGFTQILLTYNLSVITALLGFSTLWLGCGTLAKDIEECQVQMVAVKPIARWQIWLGKWLGLVGLNAVLLALAGASVYGLLQWRAQRLPLDQQQVLDNEIFVARAALREPPPDLDTDVDRYFRERIEQARLQNNPVAPEEYPAVRQAIRDQLLAGVQVVPPNYLRRWTLDLGFGKDRLRDETMFLRFKFHAARTNLTGTYLGLWKVGPPNTERVSSELLSLAADSFHEIPIPANLWDESGKLTVEFHNRNDTALLFPLEDGFEVLYRDGGFALNYARGLLIILCWLSLLAALGLASASVMSFPVAAFVSASLLFVVLSSGTLSTVVSEGSLLGADHEGGASAATWIDAVLVPLFRAILGVVNLVQAFSPVEALSTGRSITWGQVGRAGWQIVLLLGGIVGLIGMISFTRRELATAQGTA